MKKLNLGKLNLTGVEVLTRNQLKNVLGGGALTQTTVPLLYCYDGCSAGPGGPNWGQFTSKKCTKNSDCGTPTFTCSDGATPYTACE